VAERDTRNPLAGNGGDCVCPAAVRVGRESVVDGIMRGRLPNEAIRGKTLDKPLRRKELQQRPRTKVRVFFRVRKCMVKRG